MLRWRFFYGLVAAAALAGDVESRRVVGVDSIGITVSDLDRAVSFYTDVLMFEKVSERESAGLERERLTGVFGLRTRTARMRLGDEHIELTEYLAPQGRAIPADSRSNDGWFQHIAIVAADMDRAYAHLRRHKVRHASSGPQRLPEWNRNAAGIEAFYFKDPDGHSLEVLTFPRDKGQAKWHRATKELFLGIDHTAIVIEDTDASLRFYGGILGMAMAGESENHGTEQEHLNNVFGARLRITAMRASSGPGVEFLEYLAPRDGRPYPRDSKPNDLWHWQTRFTAASVAPIERELRKKRAPFVSTGAVELRESTEGFRKSMMVRDPDGHAIEIAEQ
ncbi:MAG: VOC family protein [Bryobacterales bacterium]|nr:VOC family protein [Bryobacterales bacterium]